jgi:hypothetical protein
METMLVAMNMADMNAMGFMPGIFFIISIADSDVFLIPNKLFIWLVHILSLSLFKPSISYIFRFGACPKIIYLGCVYFKL